MALIRSTVLFLNRVGCLWFFFLLSYMILMHACWNDDFNKMSVSFYVNDALDGMMLPSTKVGKEYTWVLRVDLEDTVVNNLHRSISD